MEVINNGQIYQLDRNKTAGKCRHWKLQVRVREGDRKFYKVKRITGSKTEAKQELDKFIDKIENDDIKSDITFRTYSTKWLDYRKKSKSFSPNTLSENTFTIKRLNEIFGDYTLRRLDTVKLKDGLIDIRYKTRNTNEQTSNSYKRKLHKTMKTILKTACEDGYIYTNPMDKVPIPKDDTGERTALTKEQFDYLQDELNKKPMTGYTTAIKLISRLGLRRGEVVALEWSDYDPENNTLTINHAYKEKGDVIGTPKSKCSRRTIPLGRPVKDILEKWRAEYDKYNFDCNYICCNNIGRLMKVQNLYRWWKDFIKANNEDFENGVEGKQLLPVISLHELRHTNLTIISRFITPFDLKNYAGWSDLGPAQIYIHNDQMSLRKGIEDANI